jgi:hypothetical protein
MKHLLAAMFAATVVWGGFPVAASAADPFETIPLPRPAPRSHRAAYACFLAGTGMITGSFALADRADRAYDHYLAASDPAEIGRRFDETTRYDRWSSATLLGGEALVAAGLYLRFLRRPSPPVALWIAPGACAVSLRF